MKRIILAATMLGHSLVHAATPIDGLYSAIFGGYSYLPGNLSYTDTRGTITNERYQAGWNAGIRFGYQSNPMRYEGEYTYLRADLDRLILNGVAQTSPNGYVNGHLFMLNAYYDFPAMVPDLAPFLGAGLGYAYLKGSWNSTGPNIIYSHQASTTRFAYQGTAGVTFNFSENYAASLAYRYFASANAAGFGQSVQAHMASAEIRYRFDEARYK